jgi:hypothetical protein
MDIFEMNAVFLETYLFFVRIRSTIRALSYAKVCVLLVICVFITKSLQICYNINTFTK